MIGGRKPSDSDFHSPTAKEHRMFDSEVDEVRGSLFVPATRPHGRWEWIVGWAWPPGQDHVLLALWLTILAITLAYLLTVEVLKPVLIKTSR